MELKIAKPTLFCVRERDRKYYCDENVWDSDNIELSIDSDNG